MCSQDMDFMLKSWNASSLSKTGFWNGNNLFANYDDCKEYHVTDKFEGKYCRITGQLKDLTKTFESGVCVPSTCTAEKLLANHSQHLHRLLANRCLMEDQPITIKNVICENDEIYSWVNPLTIILIVIGLVNVVGTLRGSSSNSFFNCFSLKQNLRIFLRPQEKIKCLDFFRVYGMMYNMFLHVYTSYCDIEDFRPYFSSYTRKMGVLHRLISNNGFTTVEIFLIISGFLVGYKFPRGINLSKKGIFILAYFYIIRYVRLTPLVLLISMYRYLLAPSVSGPFSIPIVRKMMRKEFDYNWVPLALYKNDFANVTGYTQWFPWLWYLVVDTRLYVVAPLFIIILQRKNNVGLTFVLGTVLISCLHRCFTTYGYFRNKIYASFTLEQFSLESGVYHDVRLYLAHSEMYYSPWYRIGPFLTALLFGYFQGSNFPTKLHLSTRQVRLGWTVSLVSLVTLSTVLAYPASHSHWLTATLLYGFRPTLLAIAICWIIFSGANNYKGPYLVEKFLSWKLWTYQGRISYCFYICHVVWIYYFMWTLKLPLTWSLFVWMTLHLGMLPFVYVTSLILHLCIELPMMHLGKLLLAKVSSSKKDGKAT